MFRMVLFTLALVLTAGIARTSASAQEPSSAEPRVVEYTVYAIYVREYYAAKATVACYCDTRAEAERIAEGMRRQKSVNGDRNLYVDVEIRTVTQKRFLYPPRAPGEKPPSDSSAGGPRRGAPRIGFDSNQPKPEGVEGGRPAEQSGSDPTRDNLAGPPSPAQKERLAMLSSPEKQRQQAARNNGVIFVGRDPVTGERAQAPDTYVVWEVTKDGKKILSRMTKNAKEAQLAIEEIDRRGGRGYKKEFGDWNDATIFVAGQFKVLTMLEMPKFVDVKPFSRDTATSPKLEDRPNANLDTDMTRQIAGEYANYKEDGSLWCDLRLSPDGTYFFYWFNLNGERYEHAGTWKYSAAEGRVELHSTKQEYGGYIRVKKGAGGFDLYYFSADQPLKKK